MRRVFTRPRYIAISAIAALLAFLVVNELSSLPLLFQVVNDASLSLTKKTDLALQLATGGLANNDASEMLYSVALSVLVGINVSLLLFFKRMYGTSPSSPGFTSGVSGSIAALLGFGCGTCGAIFGSAVLASVGGGGLLASLPFGGAELSYIGFGLLIFSCISLARSIDKPVVCPI